MEGTPIQHLEFRWRHRDGGYRWASEAIAPICGDGGRVEAVQAIFEDITERKHQEVQRLALAGLREQVQRMKSADDIEIVMRTIRNSLEILEIPFQDWGINVVDASTDPPTVRFHNMTRDGEWRVGDMEHEGKDLVVGIWRTGAPFHRQDLKVEDDHQEQKHIGEGFDHSARSVIDIPFSHGTLAVNSTEPRAFTERNIAQLQEIAGVLSEGYQRMMDLRILEQRNRQLEENDRLLTAFHQIALETLSSLDMDQILDNLARQVIEAGIFRSLMVALVDERNRCITVDRAFSRHGDGSIRRGEPQRDGVGLSYSLDGKDILAEAARTGSLQVAVEWDDRFTPRPDLRPENLRGQVAYFIPVLHGSRALAVLATGSTIQDKEDTLRHIEVMQPLLDQVAISLEHARLYGELQREIAERRQIEQELVRTQRLRAVGELSAGISHNLNNILTSVLGPAQLLERRTNDPAILREAHDIIAAARRARDLVHRLHLSVRTEEEDELQPVAINEIVQEVVQSTRPRWKDERESSGIAIAVVMQLGDVLPIRGTESRLHDILTNLLFNAVDAMPEAGTITIGTEAVAEGVQLTFRDTGIGMDEETRQRVFEPFFTTKMEVGTGLGLSTAYGTVTRWGGKIAVESQPGEGAVFTILFPAWHEVIDPDHGSAEVAQTRRGRLLIVEDDEGVCDLLSRLLSTRHVVEIVRDGQAALGKCVAGRYDAALIDLGIPGAPGDQVMRKLRQADPAVATVLITGWELGEADPRRLAFDFALLKPFADLDEVEDVVSRAVLLRDGRVAGREANAGS